ncbi:ras-related GTP-binding protein [Trypanosoma theileri]|uniref:Ras-related GTP-binding protein n=1 Tax=Trypanosoma theileri TaxID=67003 RepID=A0A1X0NN55_9TRYP|nr:ras-related GTP-binding protein [Trypanosoma theileri]ORC85933.1 ras-related GTP-binding protein [Trypanosoma theileri]
MNKKTSISSSSNAVNGVEPRIKIISLGSSGVGKSCVIKRYCEGRFVPKYIPTIGIDYGVKRVEVRAPTTVSSSSSSSHQAPTATAVGGKISVRVNFWDMAGAEEYLEIRNEFYAAAEGVLLVYDVTDAASFAALDGWLKEMEKYAHPQQRVTGVDAVIARPAAKSLVVVVCANKADDAVDGMNNSNSFNNNSNSNNNMGSSGSQMKGKRRVVSEAEGRRWAEEHGFKYFETSACTGMRVSEALETLFTDVVAAFM